MSDLNWCTYCDIAINHYSDSLYCSEDCLRGDALKNHPLLGYEWNDFVDFPRPYPRRNPASSVSNACYTQPEQRHEKASVSAEAAHPTTIASTARATGPDSIRSTTTTSRRPSSAMPPSRSPSLLSSSTSSLYGSPALTASSTMPNSPASSSFYSSTLPHSKFDMLLLTNDTKNSNNKYSTNKHTTTTKSIKHQASFLLTSARTAMSKNHPS